MATKQALISIHDVTPRHFARLREIVAFLAEAGVGCRFSMFVVPNFWRQWPLAQFPDFVDWLRGCAADGVEMIQHGYCHRDESRHEGRVAQWKSRNLTAGEGEFLGLDEAQAKATLLRGKRELEQLLGQSIEGFVAPAWLYGEGARAALGELGFKFAENHWQVWSPVHRHTLCWSPVVSYASRSSYHVVTSLIWSRVAPLLLSPLRTLRLALHPHDFDDPRLVDEMRRALKTVLRTRELASYRALTGPPAC